MAAPFNIYDPPNTATPITPGATPTGITALLQDRNFLNLLAGIGGSLDPKGVAGALAAPTIAYNQALASQQVGAKAAAQPRSAIRKYSEVTERLGGITPRGTPGASLFEAKKDGSYRVEGDLDLTDDLESTVSDYNYQQIPHQRSLGGQELNLDDLHYPYPTVAPSTSSTGGVGTSATSVAPTTSVAPETAGITQRYTSSTPSRIASVSERLVQDNLTAEDLKGLNPQQVDQVIGNALNATQLEVAVMGLAGRDVAANRQDRRLMAEAERRAATTAATALSAAKHKAAETIAQSNLTPQAQEALFQRLDHATTLGQARNELVEAAKLPQRVTSGEERDAYSRQQFGRTYGQLSQPEQGQVNAALLRDRANWTIQATEQGIFRINPRTGATSQIHGPTAGDVAPTGAGAPSASAPQGAPTTGFRPGPNAQPRNEAQRQAQEVWQQGQGATPPEAPKALRTTPLSYKELTPFAQSVSSEQAGERPFAATKPTGEELKALGYGSNALAAHEVVKDLQSKGEGGNAFWLAQRTALNRLSAMEGGAAGAGLGAAVGTALGGAAGLLLGRSGAAAATGAKIGATLLGAAGGAGGAVKLAEPFINSFDTESERALVTAKLQFMTAHLRKESGASISIGEFLAEDKIYFPQFGDSQEEIARKGRAREGVIKGIAKEAKGPLMVPQIVPYQGRVGPVTAGAPTAQPVPQGRDVLGLLGEAARRTPQTPEEKALQESLNIPRPPEKVLPVTPQAQQRTSPGDVPKATLPVDTLGHLMALKNLKSQDIVNGAADNSLRAIGAENMTQQLSHYGLAQKAAIRLRMKRLGIQ